MRTILLLGAMLLLSPQANCEETTKDKVKKSAETLLSFDTPLGLNLSLSQEESRAEIGLNYVKHKDLYGLSFSGKLNDEDSGEFVGLDGIDSNTKITGSWSRITNLPVTGPLPHIFSNDAINIATEAMQECNTLNVHLGAINSSEKMDCSNLQSVIAKLKTTLTYSEDESNSLKLLANNSKKECKKLAEAYYTNRVKKKDLEETRDKQCEDVSSLVSIMDDNQKDIDPLISDFGVVNFSASYFRSDFSWFNLDQLGTENSRSKSSRDGFDVTLSYAHVYPKPLIRWEVGATYQKGHSIASGNIERTICFDIESSRTECVTGLFDGPVELETYSPFVRLTKQFGASNLIKSVGLFIKYTEEDSRDSRDTKTEFDRWTIETPIHLVTLKDFSLSAGVKFAWVSEVRSNEDPFKAVVFVSAPLKIFGS